MAQAKKQVEKTTKEFTDTQFDQQEDVLIKNDRQEYVEQPIKKAKAEVEEELEFRDRLYTLKNDLKPLIFALPSRHTSSKPLLYFDKKTKSTRELRYATNQSTPFVDEQKGTVTLGKIVFKDGILSVPATEVGLQKLLSLYHPLKDKLYEEYNAVEESSNDIEWIELEIEALNLAKSLSIDELEAILRTEEGSKVSKLSSSELKRDTLLMAKRNPGLFIELAQDENVHLRNTGIRAVENNLITLSQDQRTFYFTENNRKLMTVPFNEHPYSALASWFKTDEGMDVLRYIEKALK